MHCEFARWGRGCDLDQYRGDKVQASLRESADDLAQCAVSRRTTMCTMRVCVLRADGTRHADGAR
eukprot:7388250-Prymnesium_polylepis.1